MTTSAPTATVHLAPRTWGAGEPWVDFEVPIRYRKRDLGLGWYIVRADNGHVLGMMSNGRDGWNAYLLNGAYYPLGTDLLDQPKHQSHNADVCRGDLVEIASTRAAAADVIVSELARRRAESLEDLVAAARAPFLATRSDLAS